MHMLRIKYLLFVYNARKYTQDKKAGILFYDYYLRLNSKDVDAWLALAKSFIVAGDFPRAISCYEKALRLRPECEECRREIQAIQQNKR